MNDTNLAEVIPLFPDLEKKRSRRLYMKRWNKNNPEKNRLHIKKWRKEVGRKPERRKMTDEWREVITYYLIDRDGFNCFHCGIPVNLEEYCLGHKISPLLGGRNRIDNYCLVHPSCNQKDGLKIRKRIHGY